MCYDKLVRDKIIEIIEGKGGQATYHIATPEEYHTKLKEKLFEEVQEYLAEENIEEMADIFEVIAALLAERGWKLEDVVAEQQRKREARGGFEKRLILDES